MEVVKHIAIGFISLYQRVFSPDQGYIRFIFPLQKRCVMYPSCSEYAIGSIRRYGVMVGIWRGLRRILRCHPYQKQLVDLP